MRAAVSEGGGEGTSAAVNKLLVVLILGSKHPTSHDQRGRRGQSICA